MSPCQKTSLDYEYSIGLYSRIYSHYRYAVSLLFHLYSRAKEYLESLQHMLLLCENNSELANIYVKKNYRAIIMYKKSFRDSKDTSSVHLLHDI